MVDFLLVSRLGLMYQVARRCVRYQQDVDDLVQEVSLRILRRPDGLVRADDAEAYLARVVRNVWIKIGHARPSLPAFQTSAPQAWNGAMPERDRECSDRRSLVQILPSLDERSRRVVEAWRATPMFKAAARATGLDVRQVKRCLARVAFELLRSKDG